MKQERRGDEWEMEFVNSPFHLMVAAGAALPTLEDYDHNSHTFPSAGHRGWRGYVSANGAHQPCGMWSQLAPRDRKDVQ